MPRATPKGESQISKEMVDRYALANGTAVQIHWPSNIEAEERSDLQSWLQLMAGKILRSAGWGPGWPGDTATAAALDWREQRDRTKEALADRILEVPKPSSTGYWDAFPGLKGHPAYDEPIPPAPRPPEGAKYFNGCSCASCVVLYRVAGVEYVEAGSPEWATHVREQQAAQPTVVFDEPAPPVQPPPAPEPVRYFAGCYCAQCRIGRAVEQPDMIAVGTPAHKAHLNQTGKNADVMF